MGMLMLSALILNPIMSQAQSFSMADVRFEAVEAGAGMVNSILDKVSTASGTSLQAAIQHAIDTHPEFLGKKQAAITARQEYLRSYGALLPKLDVEARAGYQLQRNETTIARYSAEKKAEWTNDERLVLSQLLFDGGLTSSKVAADKLYSQAKDEELFNTAEEVGLAAVQYYVEVLRNRAVVELCNRNVAEHERIVELTRIRLNNGGGTQADVTHAKASLNEAKANLVKANQGLEDAEAGYARLFGAKPEGLIMPDRPLQVIPKNLEAAISSAVDANRALKAARLTVSQKEQEVNSAKGRFKPALYARASTGRSENTAGNTQSYYDVSGMLTLKFNLFNGGSDKAALKAAESEQMKAVQAADNVQRTVEENMSNAYSFFKATANVLPILRETTNENAEVVVSYTDQFRMGTRTLLDLVSAQKALFNSQQIYLNGIAAHTFSFYRLCAPSSELMHILGIDTTNIDGSKK